MVVEAYKDGDNYILPLVGKADKIEISIDEDKYEIDWMKYMKFHSKHYKELSKEEYMETRGEAGYRDHLMLDMTTIKENWEKLVMTNEDPYISDNDRMEEAHAHWKED